MASLPAARSETISRVSSRGCWASGTARWEEPSLRIRTASDAVQQEYAETLLSWTTVIAGTYNQFRATADASAIAQWRERTRELAGSSELLGIDLTKVRLGRDGIVRR